MRRLPLVLLLGGLLVSAVADDWFLGAEHHGEFWWSHLFGFFSLFGLVGCLAIVLVAKIFLGPWLRRNENYYDRRKAS